MFEFQLLRKVTGACLVFALCGRAWAQDNGDAGVTIAELKELIEKQTERLDKLEESSKPARNRSRRNGLAVSIMTIGAFRMNLPW